MKKITTFIKFLILSLTRWLVTEEDIKWAMKTKFVDIPMVALEEWSKSRWKSWLVIFELWFLLALTIVLFIREASHW